MLPARHKRSPVGIDGGVMQSSWIGWVAFMVLAAMIGITSCQATFAGVEPAIVKAGDP